MADKLIVISEDRKIISAGFSDHVLMSLHAEEENREVIPGSIYLGRIMQLLPNVNAAFVKVCDTENWYLPLEKCTCPVGNAVHGDGKLHVGDTVLVQVEREAAKNKTVTVIGDFSLTGCFYVLMHGKSGLHVSKKITDREREAGVRKLTEELLNTLASSGLPIGIMLRTESVNQPDSVLGAELTLLIESYRRLIKKAESSLPGTCLVKAIPGYLKELRDSYSGTVGEYITDNRSIYEEMKAFLTDYRPDEASKLSFYEDPNLSLSKLYGIDTHIRELLGKKVWLKSGAFLVIEQTEAMVVIDVNSGKGTAGRKNDFLSLNTEAAREICRQLILRNLSGIIMIDFISMKTDSERSSLMEFLRRELKKDRVRTELVEMTKLGLVEITRAKTGKPLSEEFSGKV